MKDYFPLSKKPSHLIDMCSYQSCVITPRHGLRPDLTSVTSDFANERSRFWIAKIKLQYTRKKCGQMADVQYT